jgi:hypothetical protein
MSKNVKILLSLPAAQAGDALEARRKAVADALGICAEDVIFLPAGASVSVLEVPADLAARREKMDKEEAEKKAKEEAEKKAEEEEKARTAAPGTQGTPAASAAVSPTAPPDAPGRPGGRGR